MQFYFRAMIVCIVSFGLSGCIEDDDTITAEPCTAGETRSADDDCNTCVCSDDGDWNCTSETCLPPACDEDECGPRPAVPDQVCADGTTAGIGDCVRNDDATCGWTRTECPPACEPGEELSQFDGNDCVCNGAGQFECLCEGMSPDPSCICTGEGEWVCQNTGPTMCSETEVCTAQYHTCNCEWVCSVDELSIELGCDVVCEDPGAAPECACEDGTCSVSDPSCRDVTCEVFVDTCSCQWACDDGTSPRPACERECPIEDLGPMPTCDCQDDECKLDSAAAEACEDGTECEPFYDSCICGWRCSKDVSAEPICDQICPDEGEVPPPMCACDGDECDILVAPCEDGDTRDAGDGCNTCTCDDGSWACTEIGCQSQCQDASGCEPFYDSCSCDWTCIPADENPDTCSMACPRDDTPPPECTCDDGQCAAPENPTCQDGETRDAGDGCNTCICDNGDWACTEIGCPNECQEASGCEPFYDSCSCDWTCIPADENPVTCARACPPDNTPPPACTCEDGQCSATADATCQEGETTDDGCNTCACLNGQWACTLRFCPDECQDGDTRQEDCNSCVCDDGVWSCTERVCPEACQRQDCPEAAPLVPTQVCEDGSTAGPECLRDNLDMCNWVITVCPPSPPEAPPWMACNADSDCRPTGCGGELCANEDRASVCVALPEHACYQDSNITSCGCDNGACAWANRAALNMCLEDARQNGPQFPDEPF